MNIIKETYRLTKIRIKQTPVTTFFLIAGLTLSMLMISIGVSFVAEHLYAQKDKEQLKPPNGRQYDLIWSEHLESLNIEDCFEGMQDGTGVIINGLMVHLDESEINTYAPVSAEYPSKDGKWHYPVWKGRYFTREEVENGENVVLIGKSHIEYTYKENGKTFIDIENEKYEVLGIVGTSDQLSLWDNRIFIPCTSLPYSSYEEMVVCREITYILYNLNGNIEQDEQVIKANSSKILGEFDMVDMGEISSGNIVEDLIASSNMIYTIAIVGYLVTIMYAINIVIFWIEKRKYEIGIRKALGYKNYDIAKDILLEMCGISIIASIFAIVLQVMFDIFVGKVLGYTMHIFVPNIVIGILMILLTSIVTSVLPIIKTLKIEPIIILRKG